MIKRGSVTGKPLRPDESVIRPEKVARASILLLAGALEEAHPIGSNMTFVAAKRCISEAVFHDEDEAL